MSARCIHNLIKSAFGIMAQATMTVRTDSKVKKEFTNLCEQFGMSANTAMNIFMRAVMESRSIPFT
ncbi:MAG: type II toxin-antitoxin system RelB/DinJ family antitoxin, partial [Bacteroidetes bacterium]|nr:type II toxin-antitoxin system RelB/DinJ family antitoxin [Candidatus Colenecus caballi]